MYTLSEIITYNKVLKALSLIQAETESAYQSKFGKFKSLHIVTGVFLSHKYANQSHIS